MKLKLIGNTVRDSIYLCDNYPVIGGHTEVKKLTERAGGIANITRCLRVPYELHPTKLDSSAIIFLATTGKKTSFVTWETDIWNKFKKSFWTHISYLDRVDVDLTKVKSEFISADLSGPVTEALRDKLELVDYLLISEDELYGKLPVKKSVILRTQNQIFVAAKDRTRVYPNRQIEAVNTVGAGDAFVAEFLNCVSEHGFQQEDEEDLMTRCVEASIKYLQNQNV